MNSLKKTWACFIALLITSIPSTLLFMAVWTAQTFSYSEKLGFSAGVCVAVIFGSSLAITIALDIVDPKKRAKE